MAKSVDRLLIEMRNNPGGIRFSEAIKVATHYFGQPRQSGSHWIFKTPWIGDPRVNLQEASGGKAKVYQIRQLVQAIDKKEGGYNG